MADVRRILSKVLLILAPIAVALGVTAFGGAQFLIRLAGAAYGDIGPILRWQLLGTIAVLVWQPLAVMLQAMGHARSVAYLSFAQLIVNLGCDFWWIPQFGAIGAVGAAIASNVLGVAWVALELARRLSGARVAHDEGVA